MAAIITTPFRKLNAENFKSDVADSTNNSVYLAIGKADAWSLNTSDDTDTTPFVPGDHIDSINEAHQNILGMQKLAAGDISHVIVRRDYGDGKTFVAWDSNDSDIFDKAFYCLTDEFKVYKCLVAGGSVTSVRPSHTDTTLPSQADGYVWKYMYTVTTADAEKFLTNSFMPVKTLGMSISSNGETASVDNSITPAGTADRPQAESQVASYNLTNAAGIERIEVTNGGTGYDGSNVTVEINGDGENASVLSANVTVSNGSVTAVTLNNKGTNYTVADITFSGGGASTQATARAVISPINGHGTDPISELGAFYIALNAQLVGAGGGDLTTGNDFRQISIIKNPEADPVRVAASEVSVLSGTSIASSNTLNGLKIMTMSSNIAGSYAADDVITSNSGAKAFVAKVNTSDNTLFYYQNSKTGYEEFSSGDTVTSVPTGGSLTIQSAPTTADFVKGTGDMIFLENRNPVNRTTSQTEDIKCIIEF